MIVILGAAAAITSLLLPLSVYPGVLSEARFLAAISSPFWMPAVCLSWWAYVDIDREVRDLLGPPPGRRRWLVAAVLVLIVNCASLWSGAPRRLAFLYARPAFEASLAAAPPAYSSGDRLDWRLGVYRVDRLAVDRRGGVYLRTHCGLDGFDDPNDRRLRRAIRARADVLRLEEMALRAGMVRLYERARVAIESGLTDPAEVRRVLGSSSSASPTAV
jgi:hypothetical protein